MDDDFRDRETKMGDFTSQINGDTKPKFGDLMRNLWASESNPHRDAYFVREIRIIGRCNRGRWYQMTDKKGAFWEVNPSGMVFVGKLKGDEVFP